MIELPEAVVLSQQIHKHLTGREIREVTALQSPHKFAWFLGDPQDYPDRLRGKSITGAESHGGMVQIRLGDTSLVFHDGPNLRWASEPATVPNKHQLLLELDDSTALVVSIQMYGGIACFDREEWDNDYYRQAREMPSPVEKGFTRSYFRELCAIESFPKLSAKAFLATEQRIPGLGNGVLQDILFNSGIHPKRKMGIVSERDLDRLFSSIVGTLEEMVDQGGRDTEKDLLGSPGGYETRMSRKTVGNPCPKCGQSISKASYAGGSVYFCSVCQPLD